jgi:hypothetical protein
MSAAKSLTKEQVDQIQGWADEGAGLSEIQSRMDSEMGIKVTYMEVRFLLDDVGVTLRPVEKPEPKKEEETPVETSAEPELIADPSEPQGSGGVTVTISEVQRPGAMASGRVTFANGQKAEWYLDQFGRLGMEPENPEYRPTEEELKDFQKELQNVAKQKGF